MSGPLTLLAMQLLRSVVELIGKFLGFIVHSTCDVVTSAAWMSTIWRSILSIDVSDIAVLF